MTTKTVITPSGTEVITLTAEEDTALHSEQAADVISRQNFDDEIAQKATDKANAKAKLIAGEALTEAEADTIVI